MSKDIKTEIRTFEEGLTIYREVKKIITYEDGRVETKVKTFEIGKRSSHSDYWRSHYTSNEETPLKTESEEHYKKRKCLNEVARIANAFDNSIRLAYKSEENPANDPSKDTVLLDPDTALSEDEMGQKVDVYSGEILLGTALRKQSEKTRAEYKKHVKIAYDKSVPDVDRAASILYLAMEADAACQHIKTEAPGFVEYAKARARKYVDQEGSAKLEDAFTKNDVRANPGSKFAALVREFDTFGSQPLDYGGFSGVIESVVSQVRKIKDPEIRLEAARQLAHRYLVKQSGEFELTDKEGSPFGEGSDSKPGNKSGARPVDGSGNNPSNNQSNGSDGSPIDMDLLEKMLSSADMLGKEEEGEQDAKQVDSQSSNSGMTKPKSPSEILEEEAIGDVADIPVHMHDDVSSYLDDQRARKLYQLDSAEVRPITHAIEESLDILNRPQPCWDEYSLRRGEIDEGSFHKLSSGDDDVFYKVETLPRMKIQVGIVLDESGSMATYVTDSEGDYTQDSAKSELLSERMMLNRAGVARKLATAFAEGVKDNSGVTLSIYGHAGPSPECNVYRYIDESSGEDDLYRIAHITERLHNYDGYAILEAGRDMLRSPDDFDRRIMFIISDGEPSVSEYTGERATKHIAAVVDHLNQRGLETYTIGVDNAFPKERGELMYGKDRAISLPNFDLHEVSAIISAFLEEIARGI